MKKFIYFITILSFFVASTVMADIIIQEPGGSSLGGITPSANFLTLVPETFAQMLTSLGIGSMGLLSSTISDYQSIPEGSGIDSIVNPPSVETRFQGAVGSTIAPTPANVSYSTGTVSAPNFTSMIWGSGTQTATLTTGTIAIGKLYQLNFTPTVTGQVPTITATSGVDFTNIPTVVTGQVNTFYFRASSTSAVFTFSNTATSTWSTASTTCFEYPRPVMAREFSATAQQSLSFDWKPPSDWNGGTITVIPSMLVTNATPPTNTQTVIWSLAGFAVGSSDSLSQSLGTAQTSTCTADATYLQYDKWICATTAAITIGNSPAAGKIIHLTIDRLTSGTYAQPVGLTSIEIKFSRTLAP